MNNLNSIVGSICLSDIPKELFKKAENGKVYLNLAIFPMNKEDAYGNQYTCSCAPKEEQRKEGVNYLVGKFRVLEKKVDPTPADIDLMPPADDLPF